MARRRWLSGLFIARFRLAALATLGALAAPAALVVTPATVLAQTPPQVTSGASETEVEVGEPFSIQLKALSETREEISSPELRPPAGFSVSGPLISTQTYRENIGGRQRVISGIGASWTLVASAPGTYTIAAPSVVWNGRRLSGTKVTIKVLPQGSKPRAPAGGFLFPGGSPGSIFGPGGIFGGAPDEADIDDPNDEPNLALPRAPKNDVFLHASADKTRVVVGEQVTVSLHRYFIRGAYADSARVPMRFEDFLRYSLIGDPGVQTTPSARVGDKRFFVRLIEKYAIFPLHTGTLRTGAAVETYQPWNRRGTFRRTSEDLAIEVSEPPTAGKPPGYHLGDVGQFRIEALVQPRRIEEGGSVAVTVKVTGTGNFPSSLPVPEKTGVEWLDPEKKEAIEPRNGELSGYRSFGYVVRVTKKGTVDLGTIDLPYWNPKTKKYEIARSALGSLDVTPSATAAPTSSPTPIGATGTADDPFVNMPAPRASLAPFVKPSDETLLQGPRFYAALAAPPLLALAGIAAASLAKRTRARLAGRKTSLRTLAAAALGEAKRAKKTGDERAAAAAVERAIVLAIEDASGVKARGLLKEALADELMTNGIAEGPALRARDVLSACEKARFDPLAAADVSVEDAEALVAELVKAKSP